jgi:hypothetical protein
VLQFLLANPQLLTLEDKNLLLRQLYKELTGAAPHHRHLTRPRREVERELMRHLGHDDPRVPVPPAGGAVPAQDWPTAEEQARRLLLRNLIRQGYLRNATLG